MEDFLSFVWSNERVFMVDFSRAKTGDPSRRFPDIDDVGYHDEAFPDEHGPITSAMTGQEGVTVNFHRMEISGRAKLFAVSQDPAIVQITKPASGELTPDATQNIEFTAGKPGRTCIEIRYNWTDGPVLGRLYVQVYETILIRMRLHIVTIVQRDDDGKVVNRRDQPALFFGAACPTTADKLKRVREVFYQANQVWIPHGIGFVINDVFETEWGSAELGSDSVDPSNVEIIRAGARSPNRSPIHVNVFCIPKMGVEGIGVPHTNGGGIFREGIHNACALHLHSGTTAPNEFGKTVAHELGHYMGLCSEQQGHSTGDLPSGLHTRDDSVSRRRLMYPDNGLPSPGLTTPWRDDVGYDPGECGALVTHRRLPASQDVTFEESQRARSFAQAPGFYSF